MIADSTFAKYMGGASISRTALVHLSLDEAVPFVQCVPKLLWFQHQGSGYNRRTKSWRTLKELFIWIASSNIKAIPT